MVRKVFRWLTPVLALPVLLFGVPAWANLPANVTQRADGGGVTVAATPLPDQTPGTKIELSLNTHSVNLDAYRFESIATLRDDGGRQYPLEAVEQASGGGHHRKAVLRVGKLSPPAKSVELVVKGVGGVPERVFRWNME